MNGKTIKKRLMRGRRIVFWGRRALLTVRLPLSLISEPEPPKWGPPEGEGWEEGWLGWFRETQVSEGETLTETWDVWESGARRISQTHPTGEKPTREGWVIEELPPEETEKFLAHKAWKDKYLHGIEGSTGNPVLDEFHRAGFWAKTTYTDVDGGFLYLTYSVKWFYPHHKYRFSADLHRAFRLARKHGVRVKML
jgi:hypothetical protein